jgi:hypothetical protein
MIDQHETLAELRKNIIASVVLIAMVGALKLASLPPTKTQSDRALVLGGTSALEDKADMTPAGRP